MVRTLFCIAITLLFTVQATAQDSAGTRLLTDPSRYIASVEKTAASLEEKLDKKTQQLLEKFARQEAKLRKKLSRTDSVKALQVFGDAEAKYKELQEKLKNPCKLTQYIPRLDSLGSSLKFLQQNQELIQNIKDQGAQLQQAISKVKGLENQLQKAEQIKQFLKERRQYLKEQLGKLGFAKELKKINKQYYYYAQQVKEYKEILNDPKKIEKKALELLSKTKLFQDFMRKNSLLASLFRLPGDPNDPTAQASLAGLQTRAQVQNLIQTQIAAGGPNAQAMIQQNIQSAQAQLQQLQNSINQAGGMSSDDEIPDFRANNQKTKSFLKRFEIGTNIQSQKATNFFPVTSDLGLSVGYKLSDKSVIGVGASYKLGWGNGWRNITLTTQGAGLRSFADVKLKKSFWLTGGFEMNYRTVLSGLSFPDPFGRTVTADQWQQSGLIGLSKVVSIKSKFFKKTKLQLVWDFLSYRQVPKTQAVLFRVGYNF